MSTASKLMQRIQRENWKPTTIETDEYKLDLHQVHALTEVGFVLWRKGSGSKLNLITSGHTFQGKLVGSEEEPLGLTDGTYGTIERLLSL